jgi:hypothetical protein
MPKLETEGWYDAVVAGQVLRKNDKTGNWMLTLMCEVSDGPHKGEHAWWDGYLTPKALNNTLERLGKIFGYEGGFPGLKDADFMEQPIRLGMVEEIGDNGPRLKPVIAKPGEGGTGTRGRKAPTNDDWADLCAFVGEDAPTTLAAPKTASRTMPEDTSLPF